MAKKSKHKGRGPAFKPTHAPSQGAPVVQAEPPAATTNDEAADTVQFEAHEATPPAAQRAETVAGTHDSIDPNSEGDMPSSAAAPAPVFAAVPAPAPVFETAAGDVVDSGVGNPDDIRGVLVQLANARLLLPNATIAEVLSYAEPDAIAGAPDWLLGRIRWRGWQLPLIAFSRLAGLSEERGGLGSKVVVLKALGGGKTPFFAVLTQGFPRLVTVSRSALVVDEAAADLPEILMARVTLNQDDAYLPDLGRVERLIGEALQQAA